VTRFLVVVVAVALVVGGGAAWWIVSANAPPTIDAIGDSVQTVSRGQLPVFIQKAETADLYRFAVAHPEVLTFMPCTCGCGGLGHASNRACYVKAESTSRVTFTSHAAT
jgi:hypothetical protein